MALHLHRDVFFPDVTLVDMLTLLFLKSDKEHDPGELLR